jgi:hypothetical protein
MASDWMDNTGLDDDGLYHKREYRGKSGLYYSHHESIDGENHHIEG